MAWKSRKLDFKANAIGRVKCDVRLAIVESLKVVVSHHDGIMFESVMLGCRPNVLGRHVASIPSMEDIRFNCRRLVRTIVFCLGLRVLDRLLV